MIAHLLRHLMEEKHDFYDYLSMYHEATDPAIKSKLKDITLQEMRHYKDVHDILFKDDGAHKWSPMEHAFKEQSCE